MSHPTATWKVTAGGGEGDDAGPAVVWRSSEAECEAWVNSRIGLEPAQACLDYGWDGPFDPVPLPYAVVDRMRPPGGGRAVERFSEPHEATAWIRVQSSVEALSATPGDYEAVGPDGLEAALAAPARDVRRGNAVREVPPPPGEGRPDLAKLGRSTVAREVGTAIGPLEVRAYPDGHLRVSAGTLFDASVAVPDATLPEGTAIAFEAVVRLEGERLSGRGIRYEARDAGGRVVDEAQALRGALDQVRTAVREGVNGLLDAHPRDRDESLERHLISVLARIGEERRSIDARLASLGRSEARAGELLAEVRAKLAEDVAPEAPAPGF